MVIRRPNLSDWIQILNEEITRYETAFGNTITSVFTIVVLTIALTTLLINATSLAVFLASYGITVDIGGFNVAIVILILILTGTIVFMVIYSFHQKYSKKSKYKKAINLLREIMKGDKTNPIDIREEWFRDEKNK